LASEVDPAKGANEMTNNGDGYCNMRSECQPESGSPSVDVEVGVVEEVLSIVAQVLNIARSRLSVQSSLANLGAQSLHFMHLVFRLQKRFGINLPRRYAIPNAKPIEAYVQAVIAAGGGAGAIDGQAKHADKRK